MTTTRSTRKRAHILRTNGPAFLRHALRPWAYVALWFSVLAAPAVADTLGAKGGRLEPCPYAPRCVSSQAPESDSHYIVPFTYGVSLEEAKQAVKRAVEALPRTRLVSEAENYLHYEFTSRIIGFVDDVEFYFDDAKQWVHVRSSGRIGWWDGGVNRRRVEDIRRTFLRAVAVRDS